MFVVNRENLIETTEPFKMENWLGQNIH